MKDPAVFFQNRVWLVAAHLREQRDLSVKRRDLARKERNLPKERQEEHLIYVYTDLATRTESIVSDYEKRFLRRPKKKLEDLDQDEQEDPIEDDALDSNGVTA